MESDQSAAGQPPLADPDRVWADFLAAGSAVSHDTRVREHYGDQDAWSVILPVDEPAVVARADTIRASLGEEGLRWYTADELHVTLLMARGAPGEGWLPAARRSIEATGRPSAAIGGTGAFPQSVFLEVNPAAEIAALRQRLASLTGNRPFEHRDTPWLPHVTIAAFQRSGVATASIAASLEPFRALPLIPVAFRELRFSHIRFDHDGRVHTLEEHPILFAGGEQ